MKFMIQSSLYGYLGRLLEGREQFEEESLTVRRRQSSDQPGPSGKMAQSITSQCHCYVLCEITASTFW